MQKKGRKSWCFRLFCLSLPPKSEMITCDNDEKTIILPVDILSTLGNGSDGGSE